MADRNIVCPHGSIEIEVNLTSIKDGNKALADATAEAAVQAKAQGRTLANGYGTRRDGDMLTIIFPLRAT